MFSKIAKAFKPSGVKVELQTPRTFNWSHDELALGVVLTNRADQNVTVEKIQVQIREKQAEESADMNLWDQAGVVNYVHDASFEIGPGASEHVSLTVPTSLSQQLTDSGNASGLMKLVGKAVDAASRAGGGTNQFEVRTLVYTQGSKNPKAAVRSIGGGLAFRSSVSL